MAVATPEVSHGRGGAGNINPDTTQYVDGEVVRAGVEGSHGDGAYSTGRGGAANIGDQGRKSTVRRDGDLVPDSATRPSQDNSDYHVGRGGAGNERVAAVAAAAAADVNGHGGEKVAEVGDTPVGLADKLKEKIVHVFKK